MSYFFTSESVSQGHPDKIADQISDSLLDAFLAFDEKAKVAIETLVTTNKVILAGEVNSSAYIDVEKIIRKLIYKIGYNNPKYHFDDQNCSITSMTHKQSADIFQGVQRSNKEDQGAGDQGMVFGYAIKETDNYMPAAIELSHFILKELNEIRNQGSFIPYLGPDAKTQVTLEYDKESKPKQIDSIVISTQHDEFDKDEKKMHDKISKDIKNILITQIESNLSPSLRRLFHKNITYHINPTGKFIIGGPHGDAGLTGRKIIVDTYGGKGAHGGGAFSGKDPSKVDRSGAYAARHIAKNLVGAGISDELLVQISYAIGIAEPIGIYVNTYGKSNLKLTDGEIAKKIRDIFDLRPYAIEKRLKLREPIYQETAIYGHMGRIPIKTKKIFEDKKGNKKEKLVELFTWEKLDYIPIIKEKFNL